jgi:Kef-type K+ transport system membrane component KefB
MAHTTEILFGLFIVFLAAQIGAEVAQRLKMPSVVGEIVAGAIIGPSVLGWIQINEPLEVLAEIGAVLLLFSIGLQTRVEDLKRVGRRAALVGVIGVIVPFVMGAAWARSSGFPTSKAVFIAAAFVATSVGITARVLQELNVLNRLESRIILGAAVIDDILAMLLLGFVSALQVGNGVNVLGLILVAAQAIGFVVLIAVFGTRLMRRASNVVDKPVDPLSPLTISLVLCLGLAVAASHIGLAAIIGAFLAGMVAGEIRQRKTLEHQLQPIAAFLVPFFFVVTGAKVQVSQFGNMATLLTLLLIVALAVVSKLIGCGLGAWSLGRRKALIVGVGMMPRGEVGIIVASLGKQAGVFDDTIYALLIAMSLITSIIAPPILKILFKREKTDPQPAAA